MLTNAQMRNFRVLRDVSVDLTPFTVFVGANGGGKTTLLHALFAFAHVNGLQGQGVADDSKNEGLRTYIEVTVTQDGVRRQWNVVSMPPVLQDMALVDGTVRVRASAPQTNDLHGLQSTLWRIANGDRDGWKALCGALYMLFPEVKRVHFMEYGDLAFDTTSAKALPLRQTGDGVKRVLSLLTAFYAKPYPLLVLLDNIDAGLHPTTQRKLIEVFRGLQKDLPELQIIATTNSPYMLEAVKPEEVRVLALDAKGEARCAALTQSPRYEKWKDEFHSGEMWSFFGEQWVTEVKHAVGSTI
jgi:predicted ATPase